MEAWMAAQRVAMLFDKVLPGARARFTSDPSYHVLKIETGEFCKLTELPKFGTREQNRLAKALADYSLFLVGDLDYVLVIGMQYPEQLPTQSHAAPISEIIAETAEWDEARWEAEWDKEYP